MSDQRIEVQRTIPVPASVIFSFLSTPEGHVQIDASGMLMSSEGSPVTRVGDTFLVHMDREALNDVPLGQYTVSIRITAIEKDREIAWTIEHPLIDPPLGHLYGYVLEPTDAGTLVTSYYDWSQVPEVHRRRINFPVIPEASLRATLGILARTAVQADAT